MIEFMIALPWLAFMVAACYENEVHKDDNNVRHARLAFSIAIAIQFVAVLGYVLGDMAHEPRCTNLKMRRGL
jgi:hypothetical protein